MKKKKLLILLIVLLLVGIYVYRNYIAPQTDAQPGAQQAASDAPAEAAGELVMLDENDESADDGAEEASLSVADGADELDEITDTDTADAEPDAEEPAPKEPAIDEDGAYTGRDDVALYIHTYGRLPDNFITKKEAEALGWPGGGLDDYAYGKCIGGSHYGNYEGLLPERSGRRYTECDIDTMHRSSRGAKRIVFSNDGLIYYTGDHYESFTLLYGGE